MGRDVLPPNDAALLREALRRIAQLEQRLNQGAGTPVGRTIEVPFTHPGVLTVVTSPKWWPRWKVRLTEIAASLTVAPSSTTTVQLLIDGGGHQSAIFPAGVIDDGGTGPLLTGIDHTVGPGNYVQMRITVVGGSPAGLDMQLRGTLLNG